VINQNKDKRKEPAKVMTFGKNCYTPKPKARSVSICF